MRVTFEGRDWELDQAHIRFQHAMVIQSYTGMSIGEWEESLGFDADEQDGLKNPPPEWLKSMGALYWLMLAQNDVKTPIAEMDFDVTDFLTAFMTALVAEVERRKAEAAAKAATAPDPTQPFQTTGPPSPMSAIPPVTTPALPVPQEGGPATA